MAAKQFEVVCPAGVQEGDMITVHDPDGGSFEVAVPAGICEGQPFLVELTVDAFVSEMQQLADMDPDSVELLRAVQRGDEAVHPAPAALPWQKPYKIGKLSVS